MRLSPGLTGSLLATLSVSAWLAWTPDAQVAEPIVGRATPGSTPQSTRPPSSVVAFRSDRQGSSTSAVLDLGIARKAWPDLQAANDPWSPVPPPPPSPTPTVALAAPTAMEIPPPPQAPTFPYFLVGRFDDESGSKALLSSALQTISAGKGDTIDGQWRVESLQPGRVDLLWLPGGIRQTLGYRVP